MYLARHIIRGRPHYFIRESFRDGECYRRRNLFDLGTDPEQFIVYPGGNAYYVEEEVENALASLEVDASPEDLETLFWPFIRPEIRHAVGYFRDRAASEKPRMKMNPRREAALRARVHTFDQRRILYLRCGTTDQGRIGRIPGRLIASLVDKSRDEIEQYLLSLERELPRSEYKLYVYTTLDLQRFFPSFMAKKLPEALDQNSLDEHFEQEICRLQGDRRFWAGEAIGDVLHEYLVRYVIMFFDSDFAGSTLLQDYIKDFINRHRARRSPRTQAAVDLEQASTVFGIKKEALRTMTTRGLTRLYRRMAKKFHPDMGGSHEAFVELTEAYHALLRQKKRWGSKQW